MKTKTTPKEYITLRFHHDVDVTSCYVRSVPIEQKTSICGVPGFAVHRVYERRDDQNPQTGVFKVSHVETGLGLCFGDDPEHAITNSESKVKASGGIDALEVAIARAIELKQALTIAV